VSIHFPTALQGAGPPEGQTRTRTEFFHDIQGLEVSAIIGLIQTGNQSPIRDGGTRPSGSSLDPFGALERFLLRGGPAVTFLPAQIRCPALGSRSSIRSRRR